MCARARARVCVHVCVCVRERVREREGEHTSPSSVFSTRPFTMRANSWSLSVVNLAEMIGVLMVLDAFIISLIRGTPSVMSARWLRACSTQRGTQGRGVGKGGRPSRRRRCQIGPVCSGVRTSRLHEQVHCVGIEVMSRGEQSRMSV